ncbi:MAG: hypothetical protein Tsb0017_13980 [Geothermobacteraceae bacterium]
MKFTPRLPHTNVNVSKSHPLVELLWLGGGLILICLLIFGLLGWSVDLVVDHLPWTMEEAIGDLARKNHAAGACEPLQERVDALVATLPADSPLRRHHFRVELVPTEEVNALALPGNVIMVFSGLLKQVESENELAMVLAHELGHFAHRDHLRGLGRGLVLTLASVVLFGRDSGVTDAVAGLLLPVQAGYSRRQEAAADAFALNLLVARYGHAGGATDFFARLQKLKHRQPPRLLASHPFPEERVADLEAAINTQGHAVRTPEPPGADLEKLIADADAHMKKRSARSRSAH